MSRTLFKSFLSIAFLMSAFSSSQALAQSATDAPDAPKVFNSVRGIVFTKTEDGGLRLDDCRLVEPAQCKEFYKFSSEEVSRLIKRHKDFVRFNKIERTVFTVTAIGGAVAVGVGAGAAALGYSIFYGGTQGMIGAELVVGGILFKVGQGLVVSGVVVGGLGLLGREYLTVKIADDVQSFFEQIETLKVSESMYLSVEEYGRLLMYEPTNNVDFETLLSPLQ